MSTLPRLRTGSVILLWCVGTTLFVACRETKKSQRAATTPQAPSSTLLPETQQWAAVFIGDKKIGHQQIQRSHVTTKDGQRLRVESDTQLRIRRFGSETVMRMQQVATEDAAGGLIDFETSLTSGAQTQKTSGVVRDGKLLIRQGTGPETALPLPQGGGSFAAVDHSLERKPMSVGETRTIEQVEPLLGGVVSIALTARQHETTELLSGSFRALRIEGEMKTPQGLALPVIIWTDEEGSVLKTVSSLGDVKQTAYRTTKQIALAPSKSASFDLGLATTVPIQRNVAGLHDKQMARYRMRLKFDGRGNELASDGGQVVKLVEPRVLDVTVERVSPEGNRRDDDPSTKPTAADRSPNPLIESDDAVIVAMANKAAGDETDSWTIAKKLEQYVYRAIRKKNFSSAFDSAATVADSLSGDCTEHAVLLAALARAKKVPARVAVGLVYMAGRNAFGMHMWTEVWIGDRWIPLDATLGRGSTGPGHIKIAHTSLNGPGAYSSLLPVARLLGQMEMEVMEVK